MPTARIRFFLSLAVFFLGLSPTLMAANNVFLIMNENVDISDAALDLENQGAHVRQRVPPQILVAELPDSIKAREIPGVKTMYSSAIPLSVLRPMGVVAVAAGAEWNRKMLTSVQATGPAGVAAIRAQVAQKSLPATTPMNVTAAGAVLHASWEPIESALYYEVEMYSDSALKNRIGVTQTNQPIIDVPVPTGNGLTTVYLRVRGVDHVDTDGTREEIYGGFSSPVQITVDRSPDDGTVGALTQTSPDNDFTSEGFTLVLDWSAVPENTRVQVSHSSDFRDTVFDLIVPGHSYVLPSPGLKLDDTLYWRVKAWGAHTSRWSDTRRLKIGAPRHIHADTFVNPEAPK